VRKNTCAASFSSLDRFAAPAPNRRNDLVSVFQALTGIVSALERRRLTMPWSGSAILDR
jgi:hypothetical protein